MATMGKCCLYMKIPINDLKELSKKRKLTHAILFAIGEDDVPWIVTYGKLTEQAGQSADFGNKMKELLKWPESSQAQPSRVRKLQREVEEYKLEIQRLNDRIKDIEPFTSL